MTDVAEDRPGCDGQPKTRKRLAIIGGGSSGLITLKFALEMLPDWEVVCFEKTEHITGCWGKPHDAFVSTSTKYTTQFASYPVFDASMSKDGGAGRSEFFRGDEYGRYLEDFAKRFTLRDHVRLDCRVTSVKRTKPPSSDPGGWMVEVHTEGESAELLHFDRVVICTGLAAEAQPIESSIEVFSPGQDCGVNEIDDIRCRRVVVVGGGESAVDIADRLARPERMNTVFLSLRSGIRVSPRYHPIRGVPSDFLRNRLMLSINVGMRNWIGQRFVEARIRYQDWFERFFPQENGHAAKCDSAGVDEDASTVAARRKWWTFELTKFAKDDLFNMFHNKSDDFLLAVGEERIEIVGQAVDSSFRECHPFQSEGEAVDVRADLVVPAIGYRSQLDKLTVGEVRLEDFHLACCHVGYADIFAVGYARPVIGNIPTISELQARYVIGIIAGEFGRPADIDSLHADERRALASRYTQLDLSRVYPVEMFPYCDQLARRMGVFPSRHSVGSLHNWLRMMLAPASTMHYWFRSERIREAYEPAPIYMPWLLVGLLILLTPLSWLLNSLGGDKK